MTTDLSGPAHPSDISNFNGHQLRHVMIDGEPWFVAGDVCRCLNIHIYGGKPNAKDAVRKLDADERGIEQIATTSTHSTARKTQAAIVVSESGLYKLIMRSDKPEAKDFQNWATKVVLPSIRKTGGYLLNEGKREGAFAAGTEGTDGH